MRLHANARLSLKGRELLVDRVERAGWSLTQAAEAAGVSERTARKWLARWRAEGLGGLLDRSSAPRRVANRTDEQAMMVIAALRRIRFTGPEIAELLGRPLSTVSGILTRIGMGKLGRLGLEPARRYERERPGELVHIDVKKLGRIKGGAGKRIRGGSSHYNRTFTDKAGHRRNTVGWDYVHIAVDDCTRLAYAEVLGDEKATTAIGFLKRAKAFYASYGITVEALLTDNGSPYVSRVHAIACRAHGIRHLRTRPRRPQTNGKAERFIRTMLGGWAYGAIYASSRERTAALDRWLFRYNHHRPHSAIGHKPPIARLTERRNNLLGTYIWHTALANGYRLGGATYGADFSHNYGALGIRIHALNVVVWFFFSLSAYLISRRSRPRSRTTGDCRAWATTRGIARCGSCRRSGRRSR